MSIQHINNISNRLSLREPQRKSLEILARVCEIADLSKDVELEKTLNVIRSEYDHVEDFERDFPSLCFALATGVGKTRLMGAFISYLYQAKGIRNFFVLAPNLTIYNKLIADFTPNTPKYVFKGISEFTLNPPLIITGDTYQDGKGVRDDYLPGFSQAAHINIFNISKINSEVRGGSIPRIKRLSEYIGQSYFDYLAGLDDLVMLMDESHRYRASAGVKAINELKPILGLELTATPQIETGGNPVSFKNVIYNYPLAAAMDDGFVKEPAVATRENFDSSAYTQEGLEKVKLEDGIRIHENTKVELEVYARNNDKHIVKPFMLVVATDTKHADDLQKVIEAPEFFDGRYNGKVIQVHSKTSGEEKDEIVQQLLTVEDPKNPIEIVIHVNMLKEGWDVKNLYTIVPLRAANSKTLVEQSIGRGLRLPYDKRVGVPDVDRLTIVSHDKFQEIVDHANDPNSIIRQHVVIGRDIPLEGRKSVEVESNFVEMISGGLGFEQNIPSGNTPLVDKHKLFKKPEEQEAAKATYEISKQFERLKGSDQLLNPDVQKEIVEKVKEVVRPTQSTLDIEPVNIERIVKQTTELYIALSIDIPKIVVVPKGDVHCGFEDFDLYTSNINLQPVSQDILIQHLHDNARYKLIDGSGIVTEEILENYLIRGLIDYNDICYDDHAELLYKLTGQVVARLREYLTTEDDAINVLQYHQQTLVSLVHSQMKQHFFESASSYEATVTKGFTTLRPNNYSSASNEKTRDFRIPLQEGERNRIKSMIFGGFAKCLYPMQKFDSDSERRFAVLIENDETVIKWFKPGRGDLQIHYTAENSYEPDFIVETKDCKYMCEPKRSTEMTDDIVLAKATAAKTWCDHATDHANENGGKPWKYLLISHEQIQDQMTLEGLAARFTK